MKRAVQHLFVATLLLAASACAEGDAESVPAAVVGTTTATDSTADPATTAAPGDFGSRYNGSPVAFWFWAPY